MAKQGLLKSIFKLLLVIVISVSLFIIGLPLVSAVVNKGYGPIFIVAMLSILVVAVIVDQLRRILK